MMGFVRRAVLLQFLSVLATGGVVGASSLLPLDELLGYSLGDRITDCAKLDSVTSALSKGSPRIRRVQYGQTHEGRELFYLVATSRENMARLDSIRQGIRRLEDPRVTDEQEARKLLESLPVVVWLSFSVHGNEPSGTDAAIGLLYRLATRNDPETVEILKSVVVLIDPCQNPDGRARYLRHLQTFLGPKPKLDPAALEHEPRWPSPRGNHYFFDLNRDWFIVSQPESVGRVSAFRHFPGQVFGDFHEMKSSSTYYFVPPTEPLLDAFRPSTAKLWATFGEALAREFDREQRAFFRGEDFDSFYPGYGDTWPSLNGAIGMTFEQASPRGLAVERKDGTQITYREAVEGHGLAAWATLKQARKSRRELLGHYYRFHESALKTTPAMPRHLFVMPLSNPLQQAWFRQMLGTQGIEVRRLSKPVELRSAFTPMEPEQRGMAIPAGALVIDSRQPAGHLLEALFRTELPLPKSFVEEERHRLLRREKSKINDVTAWTLPLAAGLPVVYSNEDLPLETERIAFPLPVADSVLAEKPVALALPWGPEGIHGLFALLESGARLRVATRPFQSGGTRFSAGTLLAIAQMNPGLGKISRGLDSAAASSLVALESSRSQRGPDLGSDSNRLFVPPRIALVGDWPTKSRSFGALAFLLESRYDVPYTPIRLDQLSAETLSRFNVLVLPDGKSEDYRIWLAPFQKMLTPWVKGGGTLIGIGGAAAILADAKFAMTRIGLRQSTSLPDEKSSGRHDTMAHSTRSSHEAVPRPQKGRALPAEGSEGDELAKPAWPIRTHGALLRAHLDGKHYLGYGLPREVAVLVISSWSFESDPERFDPVRLDRTPARLRLAGHIWSEAVEALAGSAYVAGERQERGKILLFLEDPGFRALEWRLQHLFLNAILFSPSF